MAYTYTYTGVRDKITALNIDKSEIEITFHVHGTFKVDKYHDLSLFEDLKKSEVGETVLVASHEGELKWIKPIDK